MTKLEALAKDCIENHTHRLIDRPSKQDIYTREESIYISGYKECERQDKNKIAELEQKLEQTEKDLADYQFNYPTIKELEQENAGLKADYKVLSCSVGDWDELQEKYEEEQRKNNILSEQLTKAKELLAKWVELFKPKGGNIPPTPIQVETEQFLREVEK